MFKKAMRNISHYKGHFILIGILALIFSVLTCIAVAIRETAAKAADMGSTSQRFSAQGFSPFESLSRYAGIALLILLSAGAILFIVLTVLNVHKRRNEICTLNAIGMKRGKIALQFATETFAVMTAFAVIGAAAGYFVSAPAASTLLRYQMTSESQQMRNSGNWQQNGNQYNQGNGNTNGNQVNGNQANGQTNSSSQANAKQTADNQANGNQANNNQANNNQAGGDQANNNQANGNQAGGNNQGSGNSGWGNSGRNFGQGQRSSSNSLRGFSASPDIFVLLETLGIGLGFAILSSCAAAIAVSNCEPMKIMNPRRG